MYKEYPQDGIKSREKRLSERSIMKESSSNEARLEERKKGRAEAQKRWEGTLSERYE